MRAIRAAHAGRRRSQRRLFLMPFLWERRRARCSRRRTTTGCRRARSTSSSSRTCRRCRTTTATSSRPRAILSSCRRAAAAAAAPALHPHPHLLLLYNITTDASSALVTLCTPLRALIRDLPPLQTKPHGHGDVHPLLHQSGLLPKFASEGRKCAAAGALAPVACRPRRPPANAPDPLRRRLPHGGRPTLPALWRRPPWTR